MIIVKIQVFVHPLPKINDPHLKVELVADELLVPTGMLFLDKDNILVLQRYTSGFPLGGLTTVNLITNGTMRNEPVLTVPTGLCQAKISPTQCNVFNERGLLGITAKKINLDNASLAGNLEVFLYYTEITLNGEVLGNRVYKYLWDGNNLINPTLVLDLPALPSQGNVGGKILIGPDKFLYAGIGDVTISDKSIPIHEDPAQLKQILCCPIGHRNQLQNILYGDPPDNTSVIIRINPENGSTAPDNPFISASTTEEESNGNATSSSRSNSSISSMHITTENSSKLNNVYAYGIRNSFGMAFDPVSGKLWDTENGVDVYDEINLVNSGFNSGWAKVMGPMNRINATETDIKSYGKETWKNLNISHAANVTEADLVRFTGSKYSDPEFSWKNSIGVTALGFLNSSKAWRKGTQMVYSLGIMLTVTFTFSRLNKNRDGLEFNKNQTGLSDLVADDPTERSKIILGTGFDIITDIQTGPDGSLYILSYSEYSTERPDNISRIYRIVPAT